MAEGDLSSPVGEGPSPARQDDRPAPDSAGEETEGKTGLEPNSAQTPAVVDNVVAAQAARRLTMLQAFIRAGQRIVMQMMGLSPEAPAQDGAGGEQQDKP